MFGVWIHLQAGCLGILILSACLFCVSFSSQPDGEVWVQSGPHKIIVVSADTPAGWTPEYSDPFHVQDKVRILSLQVS